MKTIAELETELADLEAQEKELWKKIEELNAALAAIRTPWCVVRDKISRVQLVIELRKGMEVAQ